MTPDQGRIRLRWNWAVWGLMSAALVAPAVAVEQYWDSNGAADGLGGAGTWNLVTGNWNDATGTAAPSLWTDGNSAVFAGAADTVSLTSVQVENLTFLVSGYVFDGSSNLTVVDTSLDGPSVLNIGSGMTVTFNRPIVGSAGLTITGGGTVVFGGTAIGTIGGQFNINDGTAEMGKANPVVGAIDTTIGDGVGAAGSAVLRLTANNQLQFTGGTTMVINRDGLFDVNGQTQSTRSIRLFGDSTQAASITIGTGTLTVTQPNMTFNGGGTVSSIGAGTLRFTTGANSLNYLPGPNGATATISGGLLYDLVAAASSIINDDPTLATELHISAAISGGISSYTKAGGGVLALSGENTFAAPVTINGGGLTLDYAAQDNSKLGDSATLTLRGAAVRLVDGSHLEEVGSVMLNAGASSVTQTGGATLRMNAITRSAGATIDFSADNVADTDTLNTNGILGGWATVGGADFAMSADAGSDNPITAFTTYTALPASGGVATSNYIQTGSLAMTASQSANAIKLVTTGAAQSLNIGTTRTLTMSSGGLLFTGDDDYSIDDGTLRRGSAGDLIVHQFGAGKLTINSLIVNNGTLNLVKTGTGTLAVTNANTFTGVVRINQGVLEVTNLQDGGTASSIGSSSNASGNLVIDGGTLRYIGDGGVGQGATTNRSFQVGVGGATFDASGSAAVNFTNSGGIGFALQDGARTITLTGSNTGANTMALTLTDSDTGALQKTSLVKSGPGKWVLTGASTYTGTTTIDGGTLVVAGSITSDTTVNAGGTLGGTGTIDGTVVINVGGTISPGASPGIMGTGSQFWNSGGNYNWQIYDATGVAGVGFDQLVITGTLNLASGFNFNLWSLSGVDPDVNGDALNFNPMLEQSWVVATTTEGIVGSTVGLNIFTSAHNGAGGFTNLFVGGVFNLAIEGNDLVLRYTLIPEPTSVAVLLLGSLLLARRCRSADGAPRGGGHG